MNKPDEDFDDEDAYEDDQGYNGMADGVRQMTRRAPAKHSAHKMPAAPTSGELQLLLVGRRGEANSLSQNG